MKSILLLFLLFFNFSFHAQNEKAFVVYNSKGKKVSYKKMKKVMLEKEFVFFGEHHDNPIAHWLQLELLKDLHTKNGENLRIGFEMFEQDQQVLLNSYLLGTISDKQFKDSARLWPNYKTDYEPIIMYAKENKLFCLASNVPRKFASLMFKKGRAGLKELSESDKSYICPIDFPVDTTLSQYASLIEMGAHMGGSGINFMEAQALKDATMAHFMLLNRTVGNVYYHLNGSYHSDYYQGIIWYIQQKLPESEIGTISTVTQVDITKLETEHLGKADFIICVPESMTRTH